MEIACLAAEKEAAFNDWGRPVYIMSGRECVPLPDLADALRETIEEREQVVAALRLGIQGPYMFKHTRWAGPSDALENCGG